MNYEGLIVPKRWGYEYLQFQTPDVAIWMLHIRAGHGTSWHHHENKRTALILLAGEVRIHVGKQTKFPRPASPIDIGIGVNHCTFALADSWIMEVESPPDKCDLVRLADEYGRTGTPYETEVIQFTTAAAFPAMGFRP